MRAMILAAGLSTRMGSLSQLLPKPALPIRGTPLVAYLQRMGIGSLITCGESTSGCVRATTVDGYSNGFHMSLVEECCFDRSTLSHKVNLFDLHHKYADVMHVDQVVEHLEGL